jgi:hypothetical protein
MKKKGFCGKQQAMLALLDLWAMGTRPTTGIFLKTQLLTM